MQDSTQSRPRAVLHFDARPLVHDVIKVRPIHLEFNRHGKSTTEKAAQENSNHKINQAKEDDFPSSLFPLVLDEPRAVKSIFASKSFRLVFALVSTIAFSCIVVLAINLFDVVQLSKDIIKQLS